MRRLHDPRSLRRPGHLPRLGLADHQPPDLPLVAGRRHLDAGHAEQGRSGRRLRVRGRMMMTRHVLTRAVGLLVLALLVLTAGCSKPPKKRQFNNKLARRNAAHAAAAKEFYTKVAPLGNG